MRVSIPMKAESASNKREHWGSKAARVARERKAAALLVTPLTRRLTGGRLIVQLTRVAPRELDDDNLRGALKAFRDGVATALKVDDRTPLVVWEYLQRKGEHAVEVEFVWEPF